MKFLLATTDPQKLPITILSRCLQFHLKSLDQTQIAKQLEWVLDQEGQPFEPRALLALAKAADGSMRDALSLTDQALAHGNGSVRLDSVLAMLGTLDHRHLHQLLEAILRQDAPATMAKITEIATLGPDFDQLHAELEGLLHRIAMAQLLPASVQEQGADADSLLQLAKAMSPEEVQLCYQIVLGGRKDLPWAPDGRTALEMTCLRMLAFSPRRDALHPASLTALSPSMTSSATSVASLPGKRPAAESAAVAPISGAVPAPLASPVATSAVPAVDVSPPAMVDDIGNPADSEEEAQAAELFSQQDELLREAAGMGYQPEPALPRVQPDVSAHSAAQPADADDRASAAAYADHSRGESLTACIEPALEPTTAPVSAPEAVSAVSSMQSLLGKRNMLRSRQRGQDAPAAPAPRAVPVAPARPVAPAAAPVVTQQPAPISQPTGQGMAAMGHYDDLPPVDLDGDGYEPQGDNGDYEEYLNQGFAGQTQVMSLVPVTAPAQPTDLPPWDLDGQPSYRPGERSATAPAVTPAPATLPLVAPTAVAAAPVTQSDPPQPVMETIDWDELESDSEPQEGEATRLIPSSLLNGCGNAWAELIAHTQVGGRLRQLAINSVMTREGDKVLLTLKPEQRHLVSDKARADLAEIIGPALGQPVQVEVTLGVVPDQETPLRFEHRLYLGVREQVTRDLEQDPNVQFLVQRFGAVLHHESIEPLNR